MLAALFAQLLAQAEQAPSSPLMSLAPLGLIVVVMWLIVFRPQMKQQKEHRSFLDKLAKGDEVVTGGGVLGKVVAVAGEVVQIEVSRDVKLRVLKAQITGPWRPPADAAADKPAEESAKK